MSARYVTSTGAFMSPTSPCCATVMNVAVPLAIQVLQQFVHVQNERILLGHRCLITVEAVNHDSPDLIFIDAFADQMSKLSGESSAASTCSTKRMPLRCISSRSMFSPFMRENNRPSSSSKTNNAARSPRAIAATTKAMATSDLPVPAGPRISVLSSGLDTAAEQLIEFREAARNCVMSRIVAIFRSHEPRKHVKTSGSDGYIVIAATDISRRDT